MATSPLVEQEFVAHLFAPLDGPEAGLAGRQMRGLWDACQTQLGMTRPIVDAGLGVELPADPGAQPEGALAGLQDPAVNFQAIVRREHDVLNFSLVMATPPAPPRRRLGIGSATPPGWYEFARWWRTLTADGTGALLGGAAVFQAKTRNAAAADVRAGLPPREDDAAGWWTRGGVVDDFALWEVTPGGGHADRRLVVLARPDEDTRLSSFTWSAGDVALPPLVRYLMHAAKLRHQARVRGDGRVLTRVRDRAAAHLDRLTDLLRDPAAAVRVGETAAELAADEAALAATLAALRQMRRTVEIARGNMASALAGLLPADAALADWLAQQLVDDADYLEATRERAERMREIVGTPPSPVPPPPLRAAASLGSEPAPPRDSRVEQRLGFGVDVVDYSSRTTPQQAVVQQRLAGIAELVLQGVGLRLHDTDRQDAGDGMMVVLPPGLELHTVLPGLLHGWHTHVVADNGAHPDDRIRLRLSVAAGPFAHSAIGFTGATIIETGRLLDSQALRRAVVEHSGADLVALVSDRLHADVVGEGYPGLDAGQFEPLLVEVKSYRKQAWLWAGGPAAATSPGSRAAATSLPVESSKKGSPA